MDFFESIKNGDIKSVKEAIDQGQNVNSYNLQYERAITVALYNDQFEIAKLLLENGAKIKADDLSLSVQYDKFEAMKWLIAQGMNIDPKVIIARNTEEKPEFLNYITERLSNEQIASVLPVANTKQAEYIMGILQKRGVLEQVCQLKIDDSGNSVLHKTTSPLLLDKLYEMNFIPKQPVINSQGLNALEYQMTKGNFPLAKLLEKHGLALENDPASLIVDSIMLGIEMSYDLNKHKAINHLMMKAGIALPNKLLNLIDNPGITVADSYKFYLPKLPTDSFDAIYGYLHKLAEYYLNKNSGADNSDNISLVRKAMLMLDHDYSMEILAYGGFRQKPMEHDIIVYRGIKGSFNDDYVNSLFETGYKSFGDNGNLLLTMATYLTRDQLKHSTSHWEFSGAYTSTNPYHAGKYASEYYKEKDSFGVLMEIRIPKNDIKICGSNWHEHELILNQINAQDIRAMYSLDADQKVVKRYDNPHYQPGDGESGPTYNIEELVTLKGNDVYDELGCTNWHLDLHKYMPKSQKELLESHNHFEQYYDSTTGYDQYGVCSIDIEAELNPFASLVCMS